jgi:hypothetical protein
VTSRPARRFEPEAAVRALLVVVLHVGREQLLEMASPEDHHTVEALGSRCADPPLGIRVRLRRPPRSADDLDALGLEDLVEARSEALVAVVDEEADRL